MIKLTDPSGGTTTYAYNSFGLPTTITNAIGKTTFKTYDAAGNLTRILDAAGEEMDLAYNPQGQLISQTDSLGRVSNYTYDQYGKLATQVDPLGHTISHTYDADGNLLTESTTQTAAIGKVPVTFSYVYNGAGQLVQTINPDGSSTQTAYNAVGKPVAITDESGRQTFHEYDQQGNLTKTTLPKGSSVGQSYSATGLLTVETDAAGNQTTQSYDSMDRPSRTVYPDGSASAFTYDAAGQLIISQDPNGNLTQYTYDSNGRRTKVTDAAGQTSTTVFDAIGNATSTTDAVGHTIAYRYDNMNRCVQTTFANGTQTTTTYDAAGQLVAQVDQAGHQTQYNYDGGGKLLKVTRNEGQVTTFTYDEQNNQVSQIDANHNVTSYTYDLRGNELSRTLPAGQTEQFSYDSSGRLLTRTDFNGHVTTLSYDVLGLLTGRTPDPQSGETATTYTYTAAGRRATMQDAAGTSAYTYDPLNRLIAKATPEGTLSYTYDAANNLTSATSSNINGTAVTYGYDALNRLTSVTDARIGKTLYGYDAAGNLTGFRYPNSVSGLYSYDSLGRLTGTSLKNGGGTPLTAYTYTLGATGVRTGAKELGGRSTNYAFDASERLTNETIAGGADSPNATLDYSFDAVGNRLTRSSTLSTLPGASYSYDANDQLKGSVYDNNGNTRQSGGSMYSYDSSDRLVNRDNLVSIVYDGDGHKVGESTGGFTTSYLIDDLNPSGSSQVVEELKAGVVSRVYTWGNSLISQDQYNPSSQQWQVSFYGFDGQGSARVLTDASGTITDRYDYDAFGNLIYQSGTTPNNHLYCGEEWDANVGLYYLRARFMDPKTGRFWTADPFEGFDLNPASLHRYAYAVNDPVNYCDPTGNYSKGLGTRVHDFLGREFVSDNRNSGLYTDAFYNRSASTTISRALNISSLPKFFNQRKRPDLIGVEKGKYGDVYEMKPIDRVSQLLDPSLVFDPLVLTANALRVSGSSQLNQYISLLQNNTPSTQNFSWKKGDKWKGGIAPDWTFFPLFVDPEVPGKTLVIGTVYGVAPGAIIYSFVDPVSEAIKALSLATLLDYATQATAGAAALGETVGTLEAGAEAQMEAEIGLDIEEEALLSVE